MISIAAGHHKRRVESGVILVIELDKLLKKPQNATCKSQLTWPTQVTSSKTHDASDKRVQTSYHTRSASFLSIIQHLAATPYFRRPSPEADCTHSSDDITSSSAGAGHGIGADAAAVVASASVAVAASTSLWDGLDGTLYVAVALPA